MRVFSSLDASLGTSQEKTQEGEMQFRRIALPTYPGYSGRPLQDLSKGEASKNGPSQELGPDIPVHHLQKISGTI